MNKMSRLVAALAVLFALVPETTHAQPFDVLGTRAAGMAGAFVGVADDASAVYWNPGALAPGAFFSLVLDGTSRRAVPAESSHGQTDASLFLAATMPALGLSYYRLRTAAATPDPLLVPVGGDTSSRKPTGAAHVRLDTLVTHHAGLTLVQSLLPNVAIGSTLKLVRGVASSGIAGVVSAKEALEDFEPRGRGTTRFDLDVGVMATGGRVQAGLTVRNVREPRFETPEGRTLQLERQARAGVSYRLAAGILVAADIDLLEYDGAFGERRDAAVGVEGRLARRATVRSGIRFNTAGVDGDGKRPRAVSLGATYALKASVLLDAVAMTGSDRAGKGWGVSARFVY